MTLRWKKEKALTGLQAIAAPPRGYIYWDGEKKYAVVSPLMDWHRHIGWYWVAGWDSDVPHKNTCGEPVDTIEEAKEAATKYVKEWLTKNDA